MNITRFWKKSLPVENEDGYRVELDGRKLKAPDGTEIVIPKKYRSLAMLVAAEWEGQDKFLKASSLPITSLVTRGTNSLADEKVRIDLIEYLLRFLQTDTIWSGLLMKRNSNIANSFHQEEPEGLVKLQSEYWDTLIQWVNERFGTEVKKTYSILNSKHPESTVLKLRQHLQKFTPMELAGFEKAVLSSKSFIIPLALTEKAIDVDFAAKAARLEVLHQIMRWGEVEDAHDVEVEALKRDLAAASLTFISK
ncbi:ATP synthase complex assembly protein atp12 [Phlyctochytrium planicorne]|nr:ATP synthase complex assembly protein atp12 [Phlyctochytrium planicorne]